VFPPRRAAPTTPKLAPPTQPIRQTRKTRLLACFTCSLPHPVEHVKHVHLGVFYVFVASLTLPVPSNTKNTPIWVCFSCSPPPSPLKHERHAHLGMPPSRRVFIPILTQRERVCPFLSCLLCCYFDVARRASSASYVFSKQRRG